MSKEKHSLNNNHTIAITYEKKPAIIYIPWIINKVNLSRKVDNKSNLLLNFIK